MNPLKRLASQTAVYGVSSVFGRLLNYLLVPLLTYSFAPAEYGIVAELYAYMGFLAVGLLFGMETGYFRFRSDATWRPSIVYGTVLRFLVLANGVFLILILLYQSRVAEWLRHSDQPELIGWCAIILALDSVGAAAFARLRAEERAVRFATVKLLEIAANIGLTLFFVLICRRAFESDPESFLGSIWRPEIGVGYVFIANLIASMLKLVLLTPQLRGGLGTFDRRLFRRLIVYSLPMVIIGLAGITNEMLDRAALKYLLPYDHETNMAQLGVYSACYKLSVLMTLFIQAFRYAGEPFFFSYAREHDARAIYALVLNWFVIGSVLVFLVVTLYLDVFQLFVGPEYRGGLSVVPVLLIAGVFLGIYINLSIWYKLTDRTITGAGVAIVGSAITIFLLLWWVPRFGYAGAAWAHLVCYGVMVILSYLLGRRLYPVPYEVTRVLGYVGFGIGIYLTGDWLVDTLGWHSLATGTLLIGLYVLAVVLLEGPRLRKPGSNGAPPDPSHGRAS